MREAIDRGEAVCEAVTDALKAGRAGALPPEHRVVIVCSKKTQQHLKRALKIAPDERFGSSCEWRTHWSRDTAGLRFDGHLVTFKQPGDEAERKKLAYAQEAAKDTADVNAEMSELLARGFTYEEAWLRCFVFDHEGDAYFY